MAYTAGLLFLVALWGLWRLRRHRLDSSSRFLRLAVWAVVLPFLMNTAGWLLTEDGRQPWIVRHPADQGRRVAVRQPAEVAFSIIVFFLLYAALAVIDVMLMMRYARREIPPAPAGEGDEPAVVPAMSY